MYDFTPYETDRYVSAEDDAVMAEHEREKRKSRLLNEMSADPDTSCPDCNLSFNDCECDDSAFDDEDDFDDEEIITDDD